MNLLSLKSLLSCCLVVLISMTSSPSSSARAQSLVAQLKEKYDELPDKGKFATGAFAGFVGSRIAVKSAVSIVKVAGAAFIATEVMNAAGILDEVKGNFIPERSEILEGVKQRALSAANDFRTSIRRRLNPDKIKEFYESDPMATMGVATGAFVGFLL